MESALAGKVRLQTSLGIRREESTMKFAQTNDHSKLTSDKPATTRDQTFDSRLSGSQKQIPRMQSATGIRRHGSVVHFAQSQPSI